MRKSRFTKEQILGILHKLGSGARIDENRQLKRIVAGQALNLQVVTELPRTTW